MQITLATPDDLGPGDLLPPAADDPRLVPAYADVDADELPFELSRELGLGRPRVLSLDGRPPSASSPSSPCLNASALSTACLANRRLW